jgi:hypothetical protein
VYPSVFSLDIVMQGYVYVENERSETLKFQSKYFVLFPFCGLRWFSEEPEEKNVTKLLMSAKEGGWIFGGNIRVNSVLPELPSTYNLLIDKSIYPFVIELVCADRVIKLRLGCEEDQVRHLWMEEIIKAMRIQQYLYSCSECGAVPSKSIFCAATADLPSVVLENVNLTIPTLGSLVMICKLNESRGTILQAIHLENAQISDHHVPLLSSFLSFSPHIQSLSLAGNYITDEGVSHLSETLSTCSKVVLLDLSSNFIGDDGVETLSCSLHLLPLLSHLDLSRNRLTAASAKSLALSIAKFGSVLTSLNLSYNSIGDPAASLASLLLTNEPVCIENINLAHCGVLGTGFKELARCLERYQSLLLIIHNTNLMPH